MFERVKRIGSHRLIVKTKDHKHMANAGDCSSKINRLTMYMFDPRIRPYLMLACKPRISMFQSIKLIGQL